MPRILNCFDAAFVINVDAETERFKKVSTELARVGIAFERLPGIVEGPPSPFIRTRSVCVTMSHCRAVNLARERGYSNVLIFEDDAIFRPDFLGQWRSLEHEVQNLAYDLFYFYDWSCEKAGTSYSITPITGTLCAHAYSVSSTFYDSYLTALTSLNHRAAIDRILFHIRASKWATIPSLVGQDAGMSTVYDYFKTARWSSHDK